MSKRPLFHILLVLLVLASSPLLASAQAQPKAVVLFTKAEEQDASLALDILFTMVDENDQLLPKDAIKIDNGGTVQLLTGASTPVTATIAAATAPIKIALVLDASNSMARAFEATREAAIKFVNAMPANVDVGVFSFSNDLRQELEFTNKSAAARIEAALRNITLHNNPKPNTCIYNAGYNAMRALEAAQGSDPAERRAVVLFTDGLDNELPENGCSEIREQDVIAEATQSGRVPIQVHTIGLCADPSCSRVDGGKLKALSTATKASSVVGGSDQLDAMFTTILNVLDSQFVAKANVLPPRGVNRANLTFSATINEIPRTFNVTTDDFNSENDYTAPATAVELLSPTYGQASDAYTLTLNLSNSALIATISVEAIDKDGGVTVGSPIAVEQPGATETLQFPSAEFTANKEYCFRARAIQDGGGELRNADGGTVLSEQCVRHTPRTGVRIDERTFNTATGVYAVKVSLDNPGAVRQITLTAVDKAANVTVGAPITRDQLGPTIDLEQPTNGFIAGKEYCARITAIDRNGVNLTVEGNNIVAESCGVFDPATEKTFSFRITSADTSPDQKSLVVNLEVNRSSGAQTLSYRGFVNQGTRRVTDISEELLKGNQLSIALPVTETDRLLDQTGSSEYTISLTMLEPSKPDASTSAEFKSNTTPPVRLSFIQRIGLAFLNPFVWGGLLLLLLAGVGIVFYSRREKNRSKRSNVVQPPPSPYNSQTQHLDQGLVVDPVIAAAAARQIPRIDSGATEMGDNATVFGDVGGATVVESGPPQPRLRMTILQTLDASQMRDNVITNFPCTFGRGGGPDHVDVVVLNDSKISRAHARITLTGGRFMLTDLKSTNGTYVNDNRLNAGDTVPITGRTEIGLGRYTRIAIEPI